jgi:acyl-CoA ligase (AMP-forming) (exosortase A-associated)
MTLFHELFEATVALHPTRVALRYQGQGLTYAEVCGRSISVANALRAAGVQRGDRVAVYMKNRPEVIDFALGCSRIGAIFVPINPMLKSRQLSYMLRDSGACVLMLTAAALGGAAESIAGSPELRAVVVCDSLGPEQNASAHSRPFDEFLAFDNTAAPDSGCVDKDPAAIMYTSSSTGLPKGVVVSHHNLVSGARCVAQYLCSNAEDRVLAALPLSFDYGFSQVTMAFAVGACAVLTHYSMVATLLREIDAESITGLAGVPTMWAHLGASDWPTGGGSTLRYITNSGGAIVPAILRKLQARLPQVSIYSMYGLTEAFRSTYLDPKELAVRPQSIGKAIPNQEVLVMHPDGSLCEPGQVGELVHRGSLVTLGYWGSEELTNARFRPLPASHPGLVAEIAVWSGDMVKSDEEGFLYFIGRSDQQIKTSGYRVSPTEVEEVAMEVPGTIEVVAVGLPDEVLGQRIVLAIVDDGADDNIVESVRQYCRKHLPTFMAPTHFIRIERMPYTPNGKYDRAAVQAQLQEILDLEKNSA